MPIFTYDCSKHGSMEFLVRKSGDPKESIRCPKDVCVETSTSTRYKKCNRKAKLNIAVLVKMKPDPYWHTGKYVGTLDMTFKTEKSYKQFLKSTDRREAEPGDILQTVRGQQKRTEREEKKALDHVIATVKDYADVIPLD